MNNQVTMEAAKDRLRQAIDNKLQKKPYTTSDAYVQSVSRDQVGRSFAATVNIDGVSGFSMKTYGADVGVGDRIEVYNASGEPAAPDWRMAGVLPSVATETRRVGGNSYDGLDLLNLDAIRVQGSGYIVVGGSIVEDLDGNPIPAGARTEMRREAILGFGGSGENLAFGLFADDYVREESGITHTFRKGDALLGLLNSGHLIVDSQTGSLKWQVGDRELFESKLVDNNPITTLRGWLFVGPWDGPGPGISIGRRPGATGFDVALISRVGVPLVTLSADITGDVYEAYARFGPPEPFPGMTIRVDPTTDEVSLVLDGGTIIAGTVIADAFLDNSLTGNKLADETVLGTKLAYQTITADKMFVQYLSAITADFGLITAGEIRVGSGTVGVDFTGLRLYNVSGSLYAMRGYNNDVLQSAFETDGTVQWAAGKGVLDIDGLAFTHNAANFFFLDATPLVGTAALMYLEADSASLAINTGFKVVASGTVNAIYGSSVSQDAIAGVSTNNIGVAGYSTASIGLYGYSTNGTGIKAKTGNSSGFSQTWHDTSNNIVGAMTSAGQLQLKVGIAKDNDGSLDEPIYVDIIDSNKTNTFINHLVFRHTTTGTPDAGFGSRFLYQLESSTTADQDAAAMDVAWSTATHASRTAYIRWLLTNGGSALTEYMRLAPGLLTVTGGGVELVRAAAEPYLLFDYNGTDVGQIRGVSGEGIRITSGNSLTEWARFTANKLIIGTGTPVVENFSSAAKGINIIPNVNDALLSLEGNATASIILVDAGATAGLRHMLLRNDGTQTKFLSLNDSLSIVKNNIMVLDHATGAVYIGDTANANMTLGLTINQGAADDSILSLKSSDVGHGFTGIAEADTYGNFQKGSATLGGLWMRGFAETGISNALALYGYVADDNTTKTASASAPVVIAGLKTDGGTGAGVMGADGNILVVRNGTSAAVMIVDEDGDLLIDGTSSAFDAYDDALLVRALDRTISPQSVIDSQFDAWVTYNRADLERANIIGQGGNFVNLKTLTKLHSGAIWQLYTKIAELEARLDGMMQ